MTLRCVSEQPHFHLVIREYVALDEGEQIGRARLEKDTRKNVANLYQIVINEGRRHRGVGTALLAVLEHEAKQWGCHTVFLHAMPMEPNREPDKIRELEDWYAKRGYRYSEEFSSPAWKCLEKRL